MPLLQIETNDSSHRAKLIDNVNSLSVLALENEKTDAMIVHRQAMDVYRELARAELKINNIVEKCVFTETSENEIFAKLLKEHENVQNWYVYRRFLKKEASREIGHGRNKC